MSGTIRWHSALLLVAAAACAEPTSSEDVTDEVSDSGSDTDSCMPGTINCECVNQTCFAELVCDAGVCTEPTAGDGDGDSGDGDGDSGDGDSGDGDSGDGDSGDGDSGDGDSGDGDSGDGDSGDGDSGDGDSGDGDSGDGDSGDGDSGDGDSGDGDSGDGDSGDGDSGDGDPGDGDGDADLTPCEFAAAQRLSLGCEYVTHSLYASPNPGYGLSMLAFANPHAFVPAEVQVDRFTNGGWEPLFVPIMVAPWGSHEVTLPILGKQVVRIRSDIPISVQQFIPISQVKFALASAVLHDRSTWDWDYYVFGLASSNNGAVESSTVRLLSLTEGTTVSIYSPVNATLVSALPGTTNIAAGETVEVDVPIGTMVQLRVASTDSSQSLLGARLTSDPDHPFAVISENPGAWIEGGSAGDYALEQLFGIHEWGTEYLGMRPDRFSSFGTYDPAYWQIIAAEDDTIVTFNSVGGVNGLPVGPQQLGAGEVLAFLADGTPPTQLGSFTISASKPVGVATYQTGTISNRGPSHTMVPPIESLVTRAVFNLPTSLGLPNNALYKILVAHPNDAIVSFDGAMLAPTSQHPISADWKASMYNLTPTTLVVESGDPFMAYFYGTDAAGHFFVTLGAFDGK